MKHNDYEKEKMKLYLKKYVETITQPDQKAGYNMYKCPLCGSGNHNNRNSDGAFSITKDGKAWKCFACNQSGDIFNLIGLHEGLENFKDQLKRAVEISGTVPSDKESKEKQPKKAIRQESEKIKAKVTSDTNANTSNETEKYKTYIETCKLAVGKTDYFKSRGFSEDIIKRFNLGYDEKARVVVIPYDTAGNYYITRSVQGKQFRKPASDGTPEPVYNKSALYNDKPCFVCESPIDAISIIVAGGDKCSAVALGGTGSQKLMEQIKTKLPTARLILSFDNDEAGMKASSTTAEELKGLNIPFIIASYNLEAYQGNKKDANDLLKSNLEQLRADILANINEIERLDNAEKAAKIEEHNNLSGRKYLDDFMNKINSGIGTFHTSTGFDKLDEELDGGFCSGLYVLGAISSLGKTTFLLQTANQVVKSGKDVLYFSLEIGIEELISKSLSSLTYKLCDGVKNNAKTAKGISTPDRYKHYSQKEKALINTAYVTYRQYAHRLYFYEGVGDINVEKIKQKVKEHIEITGNIPLIFIDYLQMLAPYDMRASDKQNTDKAVLELKRLSRDYKTTVFCISSFNRDNYSTEANMSAFKESGTVEYGSDVLLALQPQGMLPGYTKTEQKNNIKLVKKCKSDRERKVEVVVLKNRNGRTGGKISFTYYSLFNYFEQRGNCGFTAVSNDDGNNNPFTEALNNYVYSTTSDK